MPSQNASAMSAPEASPLSAIMAAHSIPSPSSLEKVSSDRERQRAQEELSTAKRLEQSQKEIACLKAQWQISHKVLEKFKVLGREM